MYNLKGRVYECLVCLGLPNVCKYTHTHIYIYIPGTPKNPGKVPLKKKRYLFGFGLIFLGLDQKSCFDVS